MEYQRVTIDQVRRDAQCVIIRVGLGSYEFRGPAENILEPESRVAWATVVHDLDAEGYRFVTPDEFAEREGRSVEEVRRRIYTDGSLFALEYGGEVAVPLAERQVVLSEVEV